jgi:hypothetical protein
MVVPFTLHLAEHGPYYEFWVHSADGQLESSQIGVRVTMVSVVLTLGLQRFIVPAAILTFCPCWIQSSMKSLKGSPLTSWFWPFVYFSAQHQTVSSPPCTSSPWSNSRLAAARVIRHHFVFPSHASHKRVTYSVIYGFFSVSSFRFFFSVSTNFAVCRVEISIAFLLSRHTRTKLGLYVRKQAVFYSKILFEPSFPSFKFMLKLHCSWGEAPREDQPSWLTLPWYCSLRFLTVEIPEVSCFQNTSSW